MPAQFVGWRSVPDDRSIALHLQEKFSSPFKNPCHRPLGTPVGSTTQLKHSAPGRLGSKASGKLGSTTQPSNWTGKKFASLRAWNYAPCARRPQRPTHKFGRMPRTPHSPSYRVFRAPTLTVFDAGPSCGGTGSGGESRSSRARNVCASALNCVASCWATASRSLVA